MSFLLLKNSEQLAVIDDEDHERLACFGWRLHSSGYVYKMGTIPEKLHKFVVGAAPAGLVTDHINHNKLDNRKANLRFIAQRENLLNNTAKLKLMFGIYPRLDKFCVLLTRNKKQVRLGSFTTLAEATQVRDQFLACENL